MTQMEYTFKPSQLFYNFDSRLDTAQASAV
jgi:hypothetical protein